MINRQFGLLAALVVAGLLTLALSGCASGGSSMNLTGTSWRLVAIDGQPVAAEVNATISFEGEEIGGNNGCNQYGGGYELEGTQMRFVNVFSTLMACAEPQGSVEASFMGLLNSGAELQMTGSQMSLTGANGTTLIFEAQ